MWLSDFEKSLIIGTIGTPLYLDIFENDCFPIQVVYMDQENIDIPIEDIPRQGFQVISSIDGGNHAMSLLLNNTDKTYKLFDSSRLINWEAHKKVNKYLLDLGYTSQSEICTIRYLPQIRDSLCILWSLFLLERECKGLNPYVRSANERSQSFRIFQQQIWNQAQKYLPNYYKFQLYILNLSLNNESYSYDDLRRSFTAALDKEQWLLQLKRNFKIKTYTLRTPYESSFLRYTLEYIYQYSYDAGYEYATEVSNKETVQEMIDVIPDDIPFYYKSYIIYMILSILLLDTKNPIDIFYGRNLNIPEKYVYQYRRNILEIINRLRLIPPSEKITDLSDYRLMEIIDQYAGLNQELKNSLRQEIFI